MEISKATRKWVIWSGLIGTVVLTQPLGAESFNFSGSAQAQSQYDGITGKEQSRPVWVHTFSINPSISIFGIPLDIPIILSTLESPWRQSFDRFGLHFGKGWFDISVLDGHPTFSQYSLNGINVRGASVKLSPGPFRFVVTGGETQRAVLGSDTSNPSFRQSLYGLKIGGGKEDGIFSVDLNFITAQDHYDSLYAYKTALPADTADTLAIPDTVETVTPEENMVAGINLGSTLFNKKLSLKGEIAFSSFARDSRAQEVQHKYIPDFLHPKLSSEFDLAFSLTSQVSLLGASLNSSFKRVGTAFHSLGNPYLLNDAQEISFGYNQGFLNNQVSLSFNYNLSNDNLSGLKTSTTTATSYSPSIYLSFRNIPYFNISYSPYFQKNNETNDTLKVDNKTDFINIGSGYGFGFFGMNHSISINTSYQSYKDRTLLTADSNNYNNQTYMLSLSHSLKIPVSFNWGVSMTQNRYATGTNSDIWGYNGGLSFNFFGGKFSPALKISLNSEKGDDADNSKLNYGLSTSFRPFAFANISLSVERNDYKDNITSSENYQEILGRLGLSTRW